MENQEQVNTAIGIAILFTIITSIFSLPNKMSTLIETNGGNVFIKDNFLWIIVVAVIIIVLTIYIKKSNQGGYLELLQNENIRLITGVLVALQGIVNLASSLPVYIMSIQTSSNTLRFVGKSENVMIRRTIIVDGISIVMILCQILFGIYLAKYYKKKLK